MTTLVQSYWCWWPNPDDRAFLSEVLKRIPVFGKPSQTLENRANLSVPQIEASIRDALYQQLRWTGKQDAANQNSESAVDLLRYQMSHPNSEWDCGHFASVYVGLLAACGIAARKCWSSSWVDGGVDVVAEYWDDGWILVVPQLNLHFEWFGRLSFYDFCARDRTGNPVNGMALSGDGDARFINTPTARWRTMSGNPCVMAGNAVNAGGSPYDPGWYRFMQIMPKIGPAADMDKSVTVIPFGTFDPESYWNPPSNQP